MNKFIDFKNYLNNYNLFLSDSELRICHFRFLKYNDPSLLNKINSYNKQLIPVFIYSLLENNSNKINYIKNNLY